MACTHLLVFEKDGQVEVFPTCPHHIGDRDGFIASLECPPWGIASSNAKVTNSWKFSEDESVFTATEADFELLLEELSEEFDAAISVEPV